jgi:[ribosomal protein S5]-alanine N-acetyltransferase
MPLQNIVTQRLILVPYTREMIAGILAADYTLLYNEGLHLAKGWPDAVALDTMPRIAKNLEKVPAPTGFETWMLVKKEGMQIIGDAGFKGVPNEEGVVDIGYGIIKEQQKKGYVTEAAQALVNWAFAQPCVKLITAKCLHANAASANILEKLQLKETTRDDLFIYWALPKSSYQQP